MTEPPGERFHLHGRRHGRGLRTGRKELLERLLPKLRIDVPVPGTLIDPATLFPSEPGEVWLEIGFGGGEHLAWQALHHPEIGMIGAEFYLNGVARLLATAAKHGLGNLRIYPDDARPLIQALPEQSVGRLFLLFPDPWPKSRHAKRRLISREMLPELARILKDGAELRIASDDAGHLRWVLEHLTDRPEFEWLAQRPADWRQRTPDWPPTRYEEKALKAGRRPVYLRFRRRRRADIGSSSAMRETGLRRL